MHTGVIEYRKSLENNSENYFYCNPLCCSAKNDIILAFFLKDMDNSKICLLKYNSEINH